MHRCISATSLLFAAACGGPTVVPTSAPATPVAIANAPADAWTGNSYDCLTLVDGNVRMLHLPEGTHDQVVALTGAVPGSDAHSLARIHDDLFTCDSQTGLHRTALATGATQSLGVPCDAVAAYGPSLIVIAHSSELTLIPDPFNPTRNQVMGLSPYASRLVVHGDRLFTAWHAASEVQVFGLDPPRDLGTVKLEGFDDWVMGMSVTPDDRLIINSIWSAERVAVFDVNTGAAVANVPMNPPDAPSGLICEIRR